MSYSFQPPKRREKFKQTVPRRKFTQDEDVRLKILVDTFGNCSWDKIAEFLPDRTARQCRDRYRNYLLANLTSDPFSEEEDQIIIQKYSEFGPRWVQIAKLLGKRSGNDVKNRWHKHLFKQYQMHQHSNYNLPSKQTIQVLINKPMPPIHQKSDPNHPFLVDDTEDSQTKQFVNKDTLSMNLHQEQYETTSYESDFYSSPTDEKPSNVDENRSFTLDSNPGQNYNDFWCRPNSIQSFSHLDQHNRPRLLASGRSLSTAYKVLADVPPMDSHDSSQRVTHHFPISTNQNSSLSAHDCGLFGAPECAEVVEENHDFTTGSNSSSGVSQNLDDSEIDNFFSQLEQYISFEKADLSNDIEVYF